MGAFIGGGERDGVWIVGGKRRQGWKVIDTIIVSKIKKERNDMAFSCFGKI